MTVWICIDTSKQVGDVDHVKAFASADAAQAWFDEHDPEDAPISIYANAAVLDVLIAYRDRADFDTIELMRYPGGLRWRGGR